MRIECEKDTFLLFEGIEITYWIENVGTSKERFRYAEIEELLVVDDVGDSVLPCALSMIRHIPMFLRADSTLEFSDWVWLDVGAIAWKHPSELLDGQTFDKPFQCPNIPPGIYRVFAKNMKSDTLTITIRPPATKAEELQTESFSAALSYGKTHGRILRRGHEELIKAFIETYPGSPLLPRALGELLLGSHEMATYAAKRLILEFPETSYAGRSVDALDVSQLSDSESEVALDNLRIISRKFAMKPSVKEAVDAKLNELNK